MPPSSQLLEQAFQKHQAGKFAEAELIYSTILKTQPQNERALFLLGTLHCQSKRYESAQALLEKAVQVKPKYAEAYNSLAIAYLALGRADDAERAYRKSIQLKPQNPDAHRNLGNLLLQKKDFAAAVPIWAQLTAWNPENADAWVNLGFTQKQTGAFKEAQASFERALALKPSDALVLNNLGVLLKDLGEPEKAIPYFERALSAPNAQSETLTNLAVALHEAGKTNDALAQLEAALKADSHNHKAHHFKATLLLGAEDFKAAWPEYEWRLKGPGFESMTAFSQPRWDGSQLAGKSLLIHGEQGISDELHFATCISEAIGQARTVHIECHPKLVELFAASFPKASVSARPTDGSASKFARSADFDFQIPMGSLQQFIRPDRESFANAKPYLKVPEEKATRWKDRIQALKVPVKIGISWRSQAADAANSLRAKGSTALSDWRPLLQLPGIAFVNLQYGDTAAEIQSALPPLNAALHDWDDLDQTGDLASLAAVIASLDYVVSTNSVAAHLAGALGKPVFTLVPPSFGGDWPTNERVNLFMPSMRYIRAESGRGWSGVFERLSEKLKRKP